jgi:hypothetical protein
MAELGTPPKPEDAGWARSAFPPEQVRLRKWVARVVAFFVWPQAMFVQLNSSTTE